MVCENRISEIEAISNLLIPHNSKKILIQKLQTIIKKTGMYMINHNVETCIVFLKKSTCIVFKVTLNISKYKDL